MQVYTAQDELDDFMTLKELQGRYGYTDESKEWLNMRKAHLQKWKIIKKQAVKAALRGRGGGGRSGRKQSFTWKDEGNIQGEGLTLGGVWTRAEAQNHFGVDYKFENDNPRGGNVSINSKVYKCRKYFADCGDHERIYVRIVEIEEGTEYKIEQGYPLGDGDGDDDEDGVSGAHSVVASENEGEEAAKQPKARSKRAVPAPAAAPAQEATADKKKKSKK